MIGILIELLVVALVGRWILDATPLQVSPKVRDVIHTVTGPYLGLLRRHLSPTWHGRDVTFPVAIGLLVLLQFIARVVAI